MNHGKPAVAATPKPGALNDRAAVPAKAPGAAYNPPPNRAGAHPRANPSTPSRESSVPRPNTAFHPNDLPPRERPAPPNTGNPKLDQKYQQQEKLFAKQEQDRQKLQQRPEHQRQTQQLEQRHVQQQQQLQEKQQRGNPKPPK